jgi:hypothetical protein
MLRKKKDQEEGLLSVRLEVPLNGEAEPFVVEVIPRGTQIAQEIELAGIYRRYQATQTRYDAIFARIENPDNSVDPGEIEKIGQEGDKWFPVLKTQLEKAMNVMLEKCIVSWNYWDDDDAKARGEALPINEETISSIRRDHRSMILDRIGAYYRLGDAEGKESSASLPGGSQTQSSASESAPTSGPTTS